MKKIILKTISAIIRSLLRIRGVKTGQGSLVLGWPHISFKGGKNSIIIGKNTTIHSWRKMNGVLTNRSTIVAGTRDARIEIGDGVGISGATIFATNCISIGKGTLIGADALILDSDMHFQDGTGQWRSLLYTEHPGSPVSIGQNCFIGARTIILKGVTIGDSCIIGAGSVVSKNVPDNHMAYGNPAVVVPRKATEQPQ